MKFRPKIPFTTYHTELTRFQTRYSELRAAIRYPPPIPAECPTPAPADELRTKLDYTRVSTGREVNKYKAQCSQLRAKWAMLSNQPGHQPTLLDEMEVPSSAELYPGAFTGGGPETMGSDGGAVINGGKSGKKGKKGGSRPNTTGDGLGQSLPAM